MTTPTTSRVETIMDAVVAALGNIAGPTASYHLNIHGRAERLIKQNPTQTNFPACEVAIVTNNPVGQYAYDTKNLYAAVLTLDVWGWVKSGSDPQGEASKIEQDICTAIEADNTLGGVCTDVSWLGSRYTIWDDSRGLAVAVVQFGVTYFVQRQDTSGGL